MKSKEINIKKYSFKEVFDLFNNGYKKLIISKEFIDLENHNWDLQISYIFKESWGGENNFSKTEQIVSIVNAFNDCQISSIKSIESFIRGYDSNFVLNTLIDIANFTNKRTFNIDIERNKELKHFLKILEKDKRFIILGKMNFTNNTKSERSIVLFKVSLDVLNLEFKLPFYKELELLKLENPKLRISEYTLNKFFDLKFDKGLYYHNVHDKEYSEQKTKYNKEISENYKNLLIK